MPLVNSEFSAIIRRPDNGKSSVLDYLCNRFTYHSRGEWGGLIRENLVKLNGNFSCGTETVKNGDKISFYVKDYDEPDVPVNYKVLFDRDGLMFVHKPAGLPVMKTGKIIFNTLINLLRMDHPGRNLCLLNRLDRETSGIVACAEGKHNLKRYSFQNSGNTWLKIYAAVVKGSLNRRGVINQPLAVKPDAPIRCRMYPDNNGKYAVTFYEVIEKKGGESLVAAVPVTGRKHQIRSHLEYAGAPVIGDRIYSCDGKYFLKRLDRELDQDDIGELGSPHHLLHCFYTGCTDSQNRCMECLDLELDSYFTEHFASEKIRDWYYSSRRVDFIQWVNVTAHRALTPIYHGYNPQMGDAGTNRNIS